MLGVTFVEIIIIVWYDLFILLDKKVPHCRTNCLVKRCPSGAPFVWECNYLLKSVDSVGTIEVCEKGGFVWIIMMR